VESFGGRLRDELLAVEAFSSLLEAGCWSRTGGSSTTPSGSHSALGYLPIKSPRGLVINWSQRYGNGI
jgi:hypothetical protein